MNQNKTEANKEQRPTDVASGAVLGDTVRTEMKCRFCGNFSSAQTCWYCATSPGVQVLAAEVTNLRAALEEIRKTLEELRDAVKRTVNLDDCGHADGVSLILVDAVKKADDVLNATAEPANDELKNGGQ